MNGFRHFDRAQPWASLPHLRYNPEHPQPKFSRPVTPVFSAEPSPRLSTQENRPFLDNQRPARGPQLLSNKHLSREGAGKARDTNFRYLLGVHCGLGSVPSTSQAYGHLIHAPLQKRDTVLGAT